MAQAAKAEQAQELLAALESITNLHRVEFAAARRPVAGTPAEPDTTAIVERHHRAALSGIGLFSRKARAAAKAAAEQAAREEIAAAAEDNRLRRAERQGQLDDLWNRLLVNDPEIVLDLLAEAFEDNEAAAAPVSVQDAEASLVVLVPAPDALPERIPSATSAGNLSLRRLTKRETADLYKMMVCGHVLATVKEGFAVAPGLSHIRVVAIRSLRPDAYGNPRVEAVLAARIAKQALSGIQWSAAAAHEVLNDASDELAARFVGPSKELAALDLGAEPDIAAVVNAIDVQGLANSAQPQ